jgi:hypothetical protein
VKSAKKNTGLSPDRELSRVMIQAGKYYRSSDLFYQRLWRERMRHLGFHVIFVEKAFAHHLWVLRLRGTLQAQCHLLVSKPPAKKKPTNVEPFETELGAEIQRIAMEMGPRVPAAHLETVRSGAYFTIAFIWPCGQPGKLLSQPKKPQAFSFLIRPWLRRIKN